IVGRKAVVGRPFMYGTTKDFLERFGLNDISDLPKVEDMSELLGFDWNSGPAMTLKGISTRPECDVQARLLQPLYYPRL
ncbi:MAG TPA: SMC-Scp complex subunit ScpB, partial [Treponemataceae bacterium]|nr:SMC-Scp complex subunit ScpB [Treponemataceae bacterium]